MGTLFNNVTKYYTYVNDELADPRTNKFWLVANPVPIMTIMFLYHRFVKVWGPAYMANRQPYNLKWVIVAYNLMQIGLCAHMTFQCITWLYLPGYYSVWCQKINYDDNEVERLIIERVWLYYFIKIVDLLDTGSYDSMIRVSSEIRQLAKIRMCIINFGLLYSSKVFFILRKKFSHVSFLHVYHHLGMCLLGYIGTKYVPGGHGIMLGFINSAVHAVMYSYYLVSILRPQWVQGWWKKYITQLQILQFLLLILHFGHIIFEPSCGYPKWVAYVFLPHNIFILILFSNFYVKEYILKKKKQ